jgi:putative FmdB family regulatory protein
MPVYEYVCRSCDAASDRILPHSEADDPGPCPACEGELRRRFSRVAVKYTSWGFNATDGLVGDRPSRGSYREVAERAERISEGDA